MITDVSNTNKTYQEDKPLSRQDVERFIGEAHTTRNLDLTRKNLSNTDLNGLDLSYVDFSGANLSHADFSGANLQGAIFYGAVFTTSANFSNAVLTGAYFDPENRIKITLLRGVHFGSDEPQSSQEVATDKSVITKMTQDLSRRIPSLTSSEPVPLEEDKYGNLRMKNSRITLDSVVANFEKGRTPEQIQESFPTLELADIYAVIAYYLHHRNEIAEYLATQEAASTEIRNKIEAHYPTNEVRARVFERWNKLQQEKKLNATSG